MKYLKNQDTFSVWSTKDPAMKKTFTGTDGRVAAIAGWDSMDENVDVGEQEITKIIEGERIDFEFCFKVPIESTDFTYLSTKAISPNQTKVTWRFNGKMPYPMNFMLPFMNMEQCLEKIYKIAKTTEK